MSISGSLTQSQQIDQSDAYNYIDHEYALPIIAIRSGGEYSEEEIAAAKAGKKWWVPDHSQSYTHPRPSNQRLPTGESGPACPPPSPPVITIESLLNLAKEDAKRSILFQKRWRGMPRETIGSGAQNERGRSRQVMYLRKVIRKVIGNVRAQKIAILRIYFLIGRWTKSKFDPDAPPPPIGAFLVPLEALPLDTFPTDNEDWSWIATDVLPNFHSGTYFSTRILQFRPGSTIAPLSPQGPPAKLFLEAPEYACSSKYWLKGENWSSQVGSDVLPRSRKHGVLLDELLGLDSGHLGVFFDQLDVSFS